MCTDRFVIIMHTIPQSSGTDMRHLCAGGAADGARGGRRAQHHGGGRQLDVRAARPLARRHLPAARVHAAARQGQRRLRVAQLHHQWVYVTLHMQPTFLPTRRGKLTASLGRSRLTSDSHKLRNMRSVWYGWRILSLSGIVLVTDFELEG